MSLLWTYRQSCYHLISRHVPSTFIQSIRTLNTHKKALQSPYSGTKDIHVSPDKVTI